MGFETAVSFSPAGESIPLSTLGVVVVEARLSGTFDGALLGIAWVGSVLGVDTVGWMLPTGVDVRSRCWISGSYGS